MQSQQQENLIDVGKIKCEDMTVQELVDVLKNQIIPALQYGTNWFSAMLYVLEQIPDKDEKVNRDIALSIFNGYATMIAGGMYRLHQITEEEGDNQDE